MNDGDELVLRLNGYKFFTKNSKREVFLQDVIIQVVRESAKRLNRNLILWQYEINLLQKTNAKMVGSCTEDKNVLEEDREND